MRFFGADGLQARLAEHIRIAQLFAGWVDASDQFQRMAPAPFSVVCFRAVPPGASDLETDSLNQRLMDQVNAGGEIFISHTNVRERFTLRLAVGNIRTTERHVRRAWEIFNTELSRLLPAG